MGLRIIFGPTKKYWVQPTTVTVTTKQIIIPKIGAKNLSECLSAKIARIFTPRMGSCRINLPHRCSPGTPRFGPTSPLQNPNSPQLLPLFPSSAFNSYKVFVISLFPFLLPPLLPIFYSFMSNVCFTNSYHIPESGAEALLPWKLTWPPSRSQFQTIECLLVLALILIYVLAVCSMWGFVWWNVLIKFCWLECCRMWHWLDFRRSERYTFIWIDYVESMDLQVYVPPHPLIKHWVSVLRNEQTPCPIFSEYSCNSGRYLVVLFNVS